MTRTVELVITRVLRAPPELVFRCLTEPEHLTRFWGPIGVSTPLESITVDLRPGGVFETIMVDDVTGTRYPIRAIYTDIDPPWRIAWTEPDNGMTSTTTLRDLGDGRTELTMVQANVLESLATPEFEAGFTMSLDRLEDHLATLT